MFSLSIERTFCAAHSLVIHGVREITHGHNFHLTVTLQGPELDADGLLVDFHALERLVDAVLAPMHNADLNALPAFAPPSGVNPSAELIAKHIAVAIAERLPSILPKSQPLDRRPRLTQVRLTEAPGCAVIYHAPPDEHQSIRRDR